MRVDFLIGVGLLCIVVALIFSQEVRSERGRRDVGILAFVGIACLVAYYLFFK